MLYRTPSTWLLYNNEPSYKTRDYYVSYKAREYYVVGTIRSDYELHNALRRPNYDYPSMKLDIFATIGMGVLMQGVGIGTGAAINGAWGATTTLGTVGLSGLAVILTAITLLFGLFALAGGIGIWSEMRSKRTDSSNIQAIPTESSLRWKIMQRRLWKDQTNYRGYKLDERVKQALCKRDDLAQIIKPLIDEYFIRTQEAEKVFAQAEITEEARKKLKDAITAHADDLCEVLSHKIREYDQPAIDAEAKQKADEDAITAGKEAEASFLRELTAKKTAGDVERVLGNLTATPSLKIDAVMLPGITNIK